MTWDQAIVIVERGLGVICIVVLISVGAGALLAWFVGPRVGGPPSRR